MATKPMAEDPKRGAVGASRVRARHGDDRDLEADSTRPGLDRPSGAESVTGEARATRWAHLSLLEEIGRGGYGRVHRAWDPALAREVALKIIPAVADDPASTEAVLQEGRLLARIRHPNVVTVYGARQVGSDVGLWMELVRGRSLAAVVAGGGPLSADEAAVTVAGLCRALAAVHAAGLLHRDVKAQNVMREDGGRIVLMDFGTGRDALASRRGDTAGTPLYMAPEVLAGEAASVASDIYSAGVVAFYLVTGRHPVEGRSMVELVLEHGLGRRRLLADCRPDLHDRFIRVVERALAPSPGDRYASAGAMLRDLLDFSTATARDLPDVTSGTTRPGGASPETPARTGAEPGARGRAQRTPRERLARLAIWGMWAAGVLLGLAALGWLCTWSFNTALARPTGFARETPARYVQWGVRSLVGPAFYMAVFAATFAMVQMLWRITTSLSTRAVGWSRRLSKGVATLGAGNGLWTLGVTMVVGQLAGLAAVGWMFGGLIDAFMSSLSTADVHVLAPLRPDAYMLRLSYRPVLAGLVLASASAWAWIARRRHSRSGGIGWVVPAVGGTLLAVMIVLLIAPYRLFSYSEFERVRYADLRCYLVGSRGTERLLYCPDAAPPRTRIVQENDPQLAPSAQVVIESIFTPATAARQ